MFSSMNQQRYNMRKQFRSCGSQTSEYEIEKVAYI